MRYYVRVGLLRPGRAPNGYADFGEVHLTRLMFIRKAQRLGFTLDEIGGLLVRHDAGDDVSRQVRRIGEQRRIETAVELRELRALHGRLCEAVRVWRRMPAASSKDSGICPLITGLPP